MDTKFVPMSGCIRQTFQIGGAQIASYPKLFFCIGSSFECVDTAIGGEALDWIRQIEDLYYKCGKVTFHWELLSYV